MAANGVERELAEEVADQRADASADEPARGATTRRNWLTLAGAAIVQWACLPARAKQVADAGSPRSLVVLDFERWMTRAIR